VTLTRAERLAIFVSRLMAAPCADSAEEAYVLLSNTLNAVEDEHSGVTYDLDRSSSDGRMYPPQSDSIRDIDGRPELTRYRSRAHNTFIGKNGAIRIENLTRDLVLSKPGCDGNKVDPP
jgi:hypothetical protein